MPRFSYSAYADTGRLIKGEIEAESDALALDMLATRGLTPVSVAAGTNAIPWWARDLSFGGSGVRHRELIHFFANFAAMLKARFPLLKALQYCHDQTRNPIMKRSLSAIRDAVADGAPLHEALHREGKVFPDHLVSLVKLGEQSNSLSQVVQRIASMLSEQHATKRELRGALIYPMILLLMAVLVMALIVFYLAPTLLPVFASAGAPTPVPLKVMAAIRTSVIDWWPMLILTAVFMVLLASFWGRRIIKACRPIVQHLPVIGPYIRQSETLRFSQTMSLMLGSGASVPQALATSRQILGFSPFGALIGQAEKSVIEGGQMSEALTQSPLIEPMAAALIEAAEETDQLTESFQTITDDLSTRLRAMLKQAMQLLVPVLTLIIGITVGAVILTTISAIMDINDIAI